MNSETSKDKHLRAVLYERLSREDGDKLTKEEKSESIKNQDLMLRNYAIDHGYEVVGVYNDEDWSGADSSRPQFNEMIKACEAGKVDIVIAKTQSRFARDMELIEKYLHNKFLEWNVQFKSVVDHIDNTRRETKKTSQILGLTDEWYLEDTSINIKETLRAKRASGEFTGSFAPYGYNRDPENKNHLIIDPVASEIVKKIFENYINGMGLRTIARDLNDNSVASPYEYKVSKGSNLKLAYLDNYLEYDHIEKAGFYKIDINYINESKEILHNLIFYNIFSKDKKIFDSKCKLYLKNYSENKMKIYYTTDNNIDYNNFDVKKWTLLKKNDIIPFDTTCVASVVEVLDRKHIINYQFDVLLENNIEHEKYYFDVAQITNDEKKIIDYEKNIRKKCKWCDQMIKKILTDEVYIGNLVQSKTTNVSYKNKKKIKKDKEDWIRVENTHESIISTENWLKVQERLKHRVRANKNGYYNPFVHKLYCKCCGKVYTRTGDCNHVYFRCKDQNEKYKSCDNRNSISKDELNNFALNKINELLNRFYNEEQLKEFKEKDTDNDLFKSRINSLNKELIDVNKELQNKKTYFEHLYEDKINGLLDTEEYMILKSKYKDDSEKLENRVIKIKEELNLINEKKNVLKNKKTVYSKYKHIDCIDIDIVSDFIDRVYIGKYDKKTKTRDMKIVWNFES